ncbi:MAG: hypothetical protein O2875_01475 [Planctomycetota bacterium]|nr:hypothetical protein [Planctomycetota bacterium]
MNAFLILSLEILLVFSSPQDAGIQQKEVVPVQTTSSEVPELPPCFAGIPSDFATRCPRTIREYFRSRGWMPSENAIKELEAVKPEITALCATATMPCDWGIDWYSTAPDLARLKGWMSLLDADSRRLERFSRRMESAERIIAMFDLARIVAAIPRLDMQREASRLGWQAIQRAEQFLPLSSDPAMATRIGDVAKAFLDAQDAASARCVETEKIRWISRPQERIRLGADGASLYLDAKSESAAVVSKANEYPLSRLKGEELLVEMRSGESFYLAAHNVWKTPDASSQLSLLSNRAESGDFGAWVAAARPDFLGIRSELTRARVPLVNLLDTAKVLASRSVVVPAPPIESK